MESAWIGGLCLILLFVLIFVGMPVAVAMGFIGILGYWVICGGKATASMIGMIPWSKTTLYSFTVIPLFVFMGNLVFHAGFGRDAFRVARTWVGQLPGGLAQATILGCAFLGAATGSTTAAAATMARIAVPEMKAWGYDKNLATGTVASAGPLASMIPPSITIVLYGMVNEQPIGKLLIAGILPGFLTAGIFMAMIGLRTWRNPQLGRALPGVGWSDRLSSVKGIGGILLLFLCVMGGIYGGIVTPTEAGAFGAFGALLLGVVMRRLTLQNLWKSMIDTARTMGMLFAIIVGSFLFTYMFAASRVPVLGAEWVGGMEWPPMMILLLILAFYIFLGTFMPPVAMLFLTMPTIFPITVALEWDAIWFGILIIHVIEMGMITPPFGLTLFATKAVVTDVSMKDIIKGVIPFFYANLVVLAILITFPIIATYLPGTMK